MTCILSNRSHSSSNSFANFITCPSITQSYYIFFVTTLLLCLLHPKYFSHFSQICIINTGLKLSAKLQTAVQTAYMFMQPQLHPVFREVRALKQSENVVNLYKKVFTLISFELVDLDWLVTSGVIGKLGSFFKVFLNQSRPTFCCLFPTKESEKLILISPSYDQENFHRDGLLLGKYCNRFKKLFLCIHLKAHFSLTHWRI